MLVKVKYMSGAGNIFTVVNNEDYGLSIEQGKEFAPALCGIKGGNGRETEGLLLISNEKAGNAEFNVHFFNPDGSFGAMCGNGGRCAAVFALEEGFAESKTAGTHTFFMAGDFYEFELSGDIIKLKLPPPKKLEGSIVLENSGNAISAGYVDVGSEHAVINKSSINELNDIGFYSVNLEEFSRPVRYSEKFQPGGVNVNLYTCRKDSGILLRTYERGVEKETGACGTGAVSTSLIAVLRGEAEFPVKITPTSRIPVFVDIEGEFPGNIKNIFLEGPAAFIGEDEIELPS